MVDDTSPSATAIDLAFMVSLLLWSMRLKRCTHTLLPTLQPALVELSDRPNRSVNRKYIDCLRHSAGDKAVTICPSSKAAAKNRCLIVAGKKK
jgi:hypothetical protein